MAHISTERCIYVRRQHAGPPSRRNINVIPFGLPNRHPTTPYDTRLYPPPLTAKMMLNTAPHPDTEAGSPICAETKRRKVRRGTHSCWECKRRKVKCSYSNPSDSRCIGCRRRGTKCLSQQDVDEKVAVLSTTVDEDRRIGDRMVRVEALIEQLANQVVSRESKNAVGTNDSEVSHARQL